MGIQYNLPCSCGEKIPIKPSQAGETVHCKCGIALPIPTLREIKQLEVCDQQKNDAAQHATTRWTRREGQMMLGALLILIGLGLAAYLVATRPKLAAIDDLLPIQTWGLWQDLRRGPDRHLTPSNRYYLERRSINRMATGGALAVAGIGLLLVVGASLMRKQRPGRFRDLPRRTNTA